MSEAIKKLIEKPWTEKYIPSSLDECILPQRIKTMVSEWKTRGYVPNMILSGPPGIGKTLFARVLAKEFNLEFKKVDASGEDGGKAGVIDIINKFASTRSLDNKKKLLFFDEADRMTRDAQLALRVPIEQYSNVIFIFTCNYIHNIDSSLLDSEGGRLSTIDILPQTKEERNDCIKQCYKHCTDILKKEELAFDKKALLTFIVNMVPSYRSILKVLQNWGSDIDQAFLDEHKKYIIDVSDIFKKLEKGSKLVDSPEEYENLFLELKKHVETNPSSTSEKLFSRMFENVDEYVEPESLSEAILILATYQERMARVYDKRIQVLASFVKLMSDVSFKDRKDSNGSSY